MAFSESKESLLYRNISEFDKRNLAHFFLVLLLAHSFESYFQKIGPP